MGRDPASRRGDNVKNAYVIAYRLPKQPDLPAAVKAARDDLAAKEKEKNEDYIVSPSSPLDKEGAGTEISLGSRTGRTVELARLDAATAGNISQLLREAAGFGRLFTGDDPSPWSGARMC